MKRTDRKVTWAKQDGRYELVVHSTNARLSALETVGAELIRHGWTYRLGNWLLLWVLDREPELVRVPVDPKVIFDLSPDSFEWDDIVGEVGQSEFTAPADGVIAAMCPKCGSNDRAIRVWVATWGELCPHPWHDEETA